MPTVFDVHQYLRGRGIAGKVKLHKLLFAVNRLSIFRTGKPMFSSEAQAWKWGPVYPDVYFNPQRKGNPRAISAEQAAIIEEVCNCLGNKAGGDLAERSHERYAEWQEARTGIKAGEQGRNPITVTAIRKALAREIATPVNESIRLTVASTSYADIEAALADLRRITNGQPLF